MRRMFLIGLTVLTLASCNKSKSPEATATATQEQGVGEHRGRGEHRGGGFGLRRMCEGDGADAHIAKMQKCQSETTAACNTQVYGTATPAKDALCGNKEKMREVWKCVREKNGGDKEKFRAERKRMHECMSGGSTASPSDSEGEGEGE